MSQTLRFRLGSLLSIYPQKVESRSGSLAPKTLRVRDTFFFRGV
jgi:hypothetical protein